MGAAASTIKAAAGVIGATTIKGMSGLVFSLILFSALSRLI